MASRRAEAGPQTHTFYFESSDDAGEILKIKFRDLLEIF